MIVLNIANPITLFLIVLAVGLLVFLGQEVKKSIAVAIPLFVFLVFLLDSRFSKLYHYAVMVFSTWKG